VSKSWLYELLARYRAEGGAAFASRSRRPKVSPTALTVEVTDLIVELREKLSVAGLDAGPETIVWHLAHTTATPSPGRRSPGIWSSTGWSSRSRRSGRSRAVAALITPAITPGGGTAYGRPPAAKRASCLVTVRPVFDAAAWSAS
jgi:hypothetical protein